MDDCRKAFEIWSKEQGWEIQGFPDSRMRWTVWKAAWDYPNKHPLHDEKCAHGKPQHTDCQECFPIQPYQNKLD